MTSGPQPTHDPRYDGIYQRGGGADAAVRTAPAAPGAPEQPPAEPSGPATAIREVAPAGPGRTAAARRNPYDPWIWAVAGTLLALGAYLLAAPLIHAREYAEAMTSVQAGPYTAPWFTYTTLASLVLLLAGVATAVVQLFVQSVRHTLLTR